MVVATWRPLTWRARGGLSFALIAAIKKCPMFARHVTGSPLATRNNPPGLISWPPRARPKIWRDRSWILAVAAPEGAAAWQEKRRPPRPSSAQITPLLPQSMLITSVPVLRT